MHSVAFNMSTTVHQHNYGEMNIDDPLEQCFYVIHFVSIPYTLHDSTEVDYDTITEVTLVYDEKNMNPV